ncbi:MAG: spermidine synthase [Desulfobulbaceae bacterium]|nr:MAG: spermidine synthase [Desulfobulbaceae bacterium]
MDRKTIHRSHWQSQLIEVVDEGNTRSLYFGGHVLQSSMYLSAPQKLALSYTRFMASPLLIDDAPERILVVGVGAGSLVRFFHHHFPDALIDGIDYSTEVIDLARSHFHLPADSNVAIHCCGGFEFLSQREDEYNYDLILIDAFDTSGMSMEIYAGAFFDLCLDHLSFSGILCLNLWSGDHSRMEDVAMEIGIRFDSTLELPVPQRGNVICLAGREDVLSAIIDLDSAELDFLQDRFDLNFREMVRVCRKNNLNMFQRISRFFS